MDPDTGQTGFIACPLDIVPYQGTCERKNKIIRLQVIQFMGIFFQMAHDGFRHRYDPDAVICFRGA